MASLTTSPNLDHERRSRTPLLMRALASLRTWVIVVVIFTLFPSSFIYTPPPLSPFFLDQILRIVLNFTPSDLFRKGESRGGPAIGGRASKNWVLVYMFLQTRGRENRVWERRICFPFLFLSLFYFIYFFWWGWCGVGLVWCFYIFMSNFFIKLNHI